MQRRTAYMTDTDFTIWFTGLSGSGKGLYKLVDEGKIKNFTGVDDPYEEPEHPEVVVETDNESSDESVALILAKLVELGYLEPEFLHEDEYAQLAANGPE
jgi:adenylylsulfate kinase-like enzyme